jgi:adenylosuccinate synthase
VVEGRPGWSQDISGARRFEDLPVEAREYVAWLEALVGSPVLLISVGPERQQVIRRGL